jgi:fatty acid desaturase
MCDKRHRRSAKEVSILLTRQEAPMNFRTDQWETLMVRVVVTILVVAGSLVLAGMAATPLLLPTAALLAALGIAGYFAVAGTPATGTAGVTRRAPSRSDATRGRSGNS